MKTDKDLESFVSRVVSSLIMWELVVFLWNNPGIMDNVNGIASRLGRRSEDLQKLLEELVHKKILNKWGDANDPIYAYQPDLQAEKEIEKFIQFNNTKEGKLIIWSLLLKKGVR